MTWGSKRWEEACGNKMGASTPTLSLVPILIIMPPFGLEALVLVRLVGVGAVEEVGWEVRVGWWWLLLLLSSFMLPPLLSRFDEFNNDNKILHSRNMLWVEILGWGI